MKPLILLCLSLLLSSAASAREFHVSPSGNDNNPGTSVAPWRTLEGARDAVRAWRHALPAGAAEPVTVWLHGGTYRLERTFELTREDGGSEAAPVVWAAYPKETVRLSGGLDLPAAAFGPVGDATALKRLPV